MNKKELLAHLLQLEADDLFIEEAYRLILGRLPDPAGLKSSLARLKMGTSREAVVVDFLLSAEAAQSKSKEVQLTRLEKIKTYMWKKRHDIRSWLRSMRNLSRSTMLQNPFLFDDLIFDLQNKLSSHNHQLSDLQRQLQILPQYAEQIKSEVIHFQHMEAQAQQRRLDQFFFDARQELRLAENKESVTDKLESLSTHGIDQYYLALEESYRGSRDAILTRYEAYIDFVKPLLAKTKELKAVDLGCGRGEWLQLLSQCCFDTRGIDFNSSMVAECRAHGLNAEQGNVIEWLQKQPDQSLDLVTAYHVIEHLPFEQLSVFMAEIFRTLNHGGIVVLETPNPDNLIVATNMFYRDPTHKKPIPKELTEHLLKYHGFAEIEVHPMHPFPKEMRLPEDSDLTRRFNHLIYGAQDYVIIGKKITV
ncbi:MAG: methyltransferase domain-containing protein [Desulfobulbaceae bacterium]|nr:methyltransferase domain-containing protein [Desulfobulbaceae bacterium]